MRNSKCWCTDTDASKCMGRTPEEMTKCSCYCHILREKFYERFFDLAVAGYLIGTEELCLDNGEIIIDFILEILEDRDSQ